ncbi:MAG: hypothetical protein IPP69_01000 [Flavobacteriales bacterium]|nr:hypothetical protein [Flavobacteriales bacterium]
MEYYSGIFEYSDTIVGTGVYSIPPYDLFTGMLVVFNSFGDTIFTKVIQPEPNELILPGKALKVDDGFVVCGQFAFPDSISGGGFLMKFDLNGNFLWRKNYMPVADDAPIRLVSAVQLPNGGFLLGGATMYWDNWNHLVIKTDSLGADLEKE